MAPEPVTTLDIDPYGWYRHGHHRRLAATLSTSPLGWQVVVPGGELWMPVTFTMDFTATAAVGNRQISAVHSDSDGNILSKIPAGAMITAGIATRVTFARGLGVAVNALPEAIASPLTDALLRASDTLTLQFEGLMAGDNSTLGLLNVFVVRDGGDGYSTGRQPYVTPSAF